METNFKPITPELKDKVLKDLVEVGMYPSFNIRELSGEYGIDSSVLEAILDQFESLGLLKQTKCLGGRINVHMSANAHDLYNHGGFYAQEELLKANIEKLNRELLLLSKELEPKLLDKANMIANIGSAIISSLGFFKS